MGRNPMLGGIAIQADIALIGGAIQGRLPSMVPCAFVVETLFCVALRRLVVVVVVIVIIENARGRDRSLEPNSKVVWGQQLAHVRTRGGPHVAGIKHGPKGKELQATNVACTTSCMLARCRRKCRDTMRMRGSGRQVSTPHIILAAIGMIRSLAMQVNHDHVVLLLLSLVGKC